MCVNIHYIQKAIHKAQKDTFMLSSITTAFANTTYRPVYISPAHAITRLHTIMTSGITRTVICTMHTKMVLPAFFGQANRDFGWGGCTDKKENKIFLIYKEIQMGSVAKGKVRGRAS